MKLRLVVALVLSLESFTVHAADPENRPLYLVGPVDSSCGAWDKSKTDEMARGQYIFWFFGFLSGYGFGSTKYMIPQGTVPSYETIALYVDKFCRDHPLSIFPGAAVELAKELRVVGQFKYPK